jgi:hypothetical protein
MKTLLRGVFAGLVGTAAMTAAQLAAARARGQSLGTPVPETWSQAPAPAQVAKRALDTLGAGDRVTKEDVPLLTNAMHWSYGTALGMICAFTARGSRRRPLALDLSYHPVYGAAVAEASARF